MWFVIQLKFYAVLFAMIFYIGTLVYHLVTWRDFTLQGKFYFWPMPRQPAARCIDHCPCNINWPTRQGKGTATSISGVITLPVVSVTISRHAKEEASEISYAEVLRSILLHHHCIPDLPRNPNKQNWLRNFE